MLIFFPRGWEAPPTTRLGISQSAHFPPGSYVSVPFDLAQDVADDLVTRGVAEVVKETWQGKRLLLKRNVAHPGLDRGHWEGDVVSVGVDIPEGFARRLVKAGWAAEKVT